MPSTKDFSEKKMFVIEKIYRHFEESKVPLDRMVVTNEMLRGFIEEHGKGLSANNPANFLKDILRSANRNVKWPDYLKSKEITARQKYREKRVFAFDNYGDGCSEPFPDLCVLPEGAIHHPVESVSLPSAARALGRKDEAWLIQTCVHQRVVETHFALHSDIGREAIDIFHLQNSVKMTPEIDAIFLLTLKKGKALVTLEAKRDEPILLDQIRGQVARVSKMCAERTALKDIEWVIPLAAKSQSLRGERVVGIFEMAPINVSEGVSAYDADQEHLLDLNITKTVAYRFQPKVSGI